MKKGKTSHTTKLQQFLLLLSFCCGLQAVNAHEVIVIAHPESSLHSLSVSELQAVFTYDLNAQKQPTTLFVLDDNHPTHIEFTRHLLHIFPARLSNLWQKKHFAGVGQLPTRVKTEAEMIERVSHTPGAIGYISADAAAPHIKTLYRPL